MKPPLGRSMCSCKVVQAYRESAEVRWIGKYAWRVDEWRDETEFDPACSYHGENGSMVATLRGQPE